MGELISRDVAVIAAFDAPASSAAKAATKTIPIVFATGADPVKVGLVDSLSRPKGNLTGVSALIILRWDQSTWNCCMSFSRPPTQSHCSQIPAMRISKLASPRYRAAADRLKQHLEVLTASIESDLEAAFATMVQQRVGSLIVMPDPFFISRSKQLVALAARHAMPAIYPLRTFADLGGLMSYGGDIVDLYQQAGIYVENSNGAKRADPAIQQSTKVELVINLKTAKALGLTIPPTLLARADEVIE